MSAGGGSPRQPAIGGAAGGAGGLFEAEGSMDPVPPRPAGAEWPVESSEDLRAILAERDALREENVALLAALRAVRRAAT